MSTQKKKNQTGIFQSELAAAIVVMWKGREIYRYVSIEEFVDAHLEGIAALELKQEKLLSETYRDKI